MGKSKSVRVGPLSSSFLEARDWGTALSLSGLPVVCRADPPAMGMTLQTMVWVTTGGECVDTFADYNWLRVGQEDGRDWTMRL